MPKILTREKMLDLTKSVKPAGSHVSKAFHQEVKKAKKERAKRTLLKKRFKNVPFEDEIEEQYLQEDMDKDILETYITVRLRKR